MLAFAGAIPDFTMAIEAKRAFQSMMRFSLVEPDLSAALHVGVQHPVDHEQRALDAADFAHGEGKVILPGI